MSSSVKIQQESTSSSASITAAFTSSSTTSSTSAPNSSSTSSASLNHAAAIGPQLSKVIDFGNLNTVLSYILDHLSTSHSRLCRLEESVNDMNLKHVALNNEVGALKSVVMNNLSTLSGQTGAASTDVLKQLESLNSQVQQHHVLWDDLKEQVAAHTSQLVDLDAHTKALSVQKADVDDLLLKADAELVEQHSRSIDALVATTVDHEARLKLAENAIKRINNTLEQLQNENFREETLRRLKDLEDELERVKLRLNEQAHKLSEVERSDAEKAKQSYVDAELENLLNKLKDLEAALAASMKAELKRFERDVMIYVADQLSHLPSQTTTHSSAHNATAAGKVHFRCLTCDQPRSDVPGAQTHRYASAKHPTQNITSNISDSRLVELSIGDQIYVTGVDGSVYKGRTEPHLLPAASSGSSKNLALDVSPPQKLLMSGSHHPHRSTSPNHTRPSSAAPQRYVTHQQIDPQSGRKSLTLSEWTTQDEQSAQARQQNNWTSSSGTRNTVSRPSSAVHHSSSSNSLPTVSFTSRTRPSSSKSTHRSIGMTSPSNNQSGTRRSKGGVEIVNEFDTKEEQTSQ